MLPCSHVKTQVNHQDSGITIDDTFEPGCVGVIDNWRHQIGLGLGGTGMTLGFQT
jgi:hypothetical protein